MRYLNNAARVVLGVVNFIRPILCNRRVTVGNILLIYSGLRNELLAKYFSLLLVIHAAKVESCSLRIKPRRYNRLKYGNIAESNKINILF